MAITKKNTSPAIAKVLPELVNHNGWDIKLDQHSFFPRWKEVAGEYVAQCTRPLKIVRDVLWIEVENSTWMQQLQFEKRRLLNDINATLTLSRLKDIKFLLPQDDEEKSGDSPQVIFVSPDPEALKKFEEQVGVIEDDAIRESLIRLWYLSKACRVEKK